VTPGNTASGQKLQISPMLNNYSINLVVNEIFLLQRIERFWGILRQKRSDFWIDHFKVKYHAF
jgi:hypothetical protein